MAEPVKAPEVVVPEKKISKMEAVRRAIAKFGPATKPTEIANFIKKQFNIVLTNDRISNYKSEINRQSGAKGKAGKIKAVAAPKAETKPTAPPVAAMSHAKPSMASTNGKSDAGIGLKDIQTVKELISRVGQKQLEGLIGLIAE